MSISLSKNPGSNAVSLTKPDGSSLTKIFVGAGWDAARGLFGAARSIDLDLSAILLDRNGTELDAVWFQHLKSNDRALRHTGDDRSGDGDGDDEVINVDLAKVNPAVASIVFTVNSYSGQNFGHIKNAFCRVVDASGAREVEVAKYDLSAQGKHTAVIMAKLVRENGGWKFTAIGENGHGRTYRDLVSLARQHV